eukprot:TRINITY_DN9400_c0_g1_i7.p1 TRINITY_DN9400_c0_g1~~TRINITY_DN9400_c0_g1_i7.p1  ORF type:complete len:458 (+),score=69.17 TRINITY_DN9400_c0_g1_i7:447-1820(+)
MNTSLFQNCVTDQLYWDNSSDKPELIGFSSEALKSILVGKWECNRRWRRLMLFVHTYFISSHELSLFIYKYYSKLPEKEKISHFDVIHTLILDWLHIRTHDFMSKEIFQIFMNLNSLLCTHMPLPLPLSPRSLHGDDTSSDNNLEMVVIDLKEALNKRFTFLHILENSPHSLDYGQPPKTEMLKSTEQALLAYTWAPECYQFNILHVHPTETARQMTLIDHRLLAMIPLEELLMGKFSKPSLSPHLAACSERFNVVTEWIGTLITTNGNIKERRQVISYFIIVAVKLLGLRNFQGLMAVFLGLTQCTVARMHQTWAGISVSLSEKWSKLESLCSPLLNFKNLRVLHDKREFPTIKASTLFTKDLTFMEDGNPLFIDVSNQSRSSSTSPCTTKYFNMNRLQPMSELLEGIHLSQIVPYQLKPVPLLQQILLTVHHVGLVEQEAASYRSEPRIPQSTTG